MNRDRTTATQPGPLCRATTLHNQYYGTSQEAGYRSGSGGLVGLSEAGAAGRECPGLVMGGWCGRRNGAIARGVAH